MLLSFPWILFVFYLLAVYVNIFKLFLFIFNFNMDILFLGNQFLRSKVPVVIELPDKLY